MSPKPAPSAPPDRVEAYNRLVAGIPSRAVTRLFEAFRSDDSALARRLEELVDPALATFSLAF